MSYYYDYYLGYKDLKDPKGKIYPLGPYDNNGKLMEVLSRSSSFASDLHEDFLQISKDEISEELRKEFETEDWNGKKVVNVQYLPIDELKGQTNFIKSGYFLIEDVENYQTNGQDAIEGGALFERLSPVAYAAKMKSEYAFGPEKDKTDEEGFVIKAHPCADWTYFAFPDYSSREYEAFLLVNAAAEFEYSKSLVNEKFEKIGEIVALKTEG